MGANQRNRGKTEKLTDMYRRQEVRQREADSEL